MKLITPIRFVLLSTLLAWTMAYAEDKPRPIVDYTSLWGFNSSVCNVNNTDYIHFKSNDPKVIYSTFNPEFPSLKVPNTKNKIDWYIKWNKVTVPSDWWYATSNIYRDPTKKYISEYNNSITWSFLNEANLIPSDRGQTIGQLIFTHYIYSDTWVNWTNSITWTTNWFFGYNTLYEYDPLIPCVSEGGSSIRCYTKNDTIPHQTFTDSNGEVEISKSCVYLVADSFCWDKVLDAWEQCDAWAAGAATCWAAGTVNACQFLGWSSSECWNDIIEIWEACDVWPSWSSTCWAPNTANACQIITPWDPGSGWDSVCWNNITEIWEQCDAGPGWSATCSSTCQTITDWGWWTPTTPGWNPDTNWNWWIDYCWDLILQPLNDDWIVEMCDNNESWCSSSCQITDWNLIDLVDNWWITIYPSWEVTLWFNEEVFTEAWVNKEIWITNNTNYPINLGDSNICITEDWSDWLAWENWNCTSSIWVINWLGWKKSTPSWGYNARSFTNDDTKKTKLKTYLTWHTGVKKDLKVNIVAPSVSNIGWWTVFGKFKEFLADIKNVSTTITWSDSWRNRNFLSSHIWNTYFSSYTSNSTDNNSVDKAESIYVSDLSWIKNWFYVWYNPEINIENMSNYNDIDNIYYYSWDVLIDWNSDNIREWRTYVIGWNLIIDSDVDFDTLSGQTLFYVKKDIVIKNSISNLDWIYISESWELKSKELNYTINRLIVNWALYWNSKNLLKYRTNISENWWLILTWTIVNFTSSIYTNPPPLFWDIVSQKITIEKFAK